MGGIADLAISRYMFSVRTRWLLKSRARHVSDGYLLVYNTCHASGKLCPGHRKICHLLLAAIQNGSQRYYLPALDIMAI